MKIARHPTAAFTVAELLIASAVAVILSVGVMAFLSTTMRMVARNMATNHSHDTARAALQKVFAQIHQSASRFQLVSFDGTTYTDVTATVTTDQDPYSQQYISNRANGVRFMILVGGPCKMTGNGTTTTVASTDTTLEFDFSGNTYVPRVGDVLQIPLTAGQFNIVAPAPVNTSGSKWKVTLGNAVGASLITVTGTTPSGQSWTNPITTGSFYRRVAYTVLGNQLRFHPNLTVPPYPATAATLDVPVLVRTNVSSPKPFGLLFPTSTSTLTDSSNLRVSLEAYDLQFGAQVYQNGTTTLQAVVPSRNQPPTLSGT